MRRDGDLSSSISKGQHKQTTVESCELQNMCVLHIHNGMYSIYFGFIYLSKWEEEAFGTGKQNQEA